MEKEWKLTSNQMPQNVDDVVNVLLENRGFEDPKTAKTFFNPCSPADFIKTPSLVGLDKDRLESAVEIITQAVGEKRLIVIHGDYDVDGLCATAILWETLYKQLGYEKILPFIPNRFEHGYGVSTESIDSLREQIDVKNPLLITVDCGITAKDQIAYAKSKGFEVLVTDHHQKPEDLPDAAEIVWSDEICGAGIGWVLAQRLLAACDAAAADSLDLVSVATLCDLEPLLGPNRSFVKYGLDELNNNTREGIKALKESAGLRGKEIGTYEIGWILGPRLNAAGRLDDATDALRLLVTRDKQAAGVLAGRLDTLNRERQSITKDAVERAKKDLISDLVHLPSFIVLDHEDYHEGVIGLVAGDMVKNFNRPSIAISRGEKVSKGSARSVKGVDIISALRECADCLVDVGGHPMAAGFTIETEKIAELRKQLAAYGEEYVDEDSFNLVVKMDCRIDLSLVGARLWEELEKFAPFGVGNPKPKFLLKGVEIQNLRAVGSDNKHLKLKLGSNSGKTVSAIAFGHGDWAMRLLSGDKIDLVASLQLNRWNGRESVELVVKEISKGSCPGRSI